jgi:hypothetical protein
VNRWQPSEEDFSRTKNMHSRIEGLDIFSSFYCHLVDLFYFYDLVGSYCQQIKNSWTVVFYYLNTV